MDIAINAVCHLVQLPVYGVTKDTIGTFMLGLALALLAYGWMPLSHGGEVQSWVLWGSFLLPLIGGAGLFFQRKISLISMFINYTILWLDGATVIAMSLILFG